MNLDGDFEGVVDFGVELVDFEDDFVLLVDLGDGDEKMALPLRDDDPVIANPCPRSSSPSSATLILASTLSTTPF